MMTKKMTRERGISLTKLACFQPLKIVTSLAKWVSCTHYTLTLLASPPAV